MLSSKVAIFMAVYLKNYNFYLFLHYIYKSFCLKLQSYLHNFKIGKQLFGNEFLFFFNKNEILPKQYYHVPWSQKNTLQEWTI